MAGFYFSIAVGALAVAVALVVGAHIAIELADGRTAVSWILS